MTYSVYACGSNGKFQLGTGDDKDLDKLTSVFQSEIPIKKISSGGNHTLILLENGQIYSSGDNTFSQCGIDGSFTKTLSVFTNIPLKDKSNWINCSTGYEFSILVNRNQELYSTGNGLKGELGVASNTTRINQLTKLPFSHHSRIKDIQSCMDHTVLLLENGEVYGWGNSRNGKIGEQAQTKVWIPTKINLGYKVESISLARDFTVFFDGSNVQLLGKDKYGIGLKIPSTIQSIHTMWTSLHIIDSNNQIKSFGNDSHGQLTCSTQPHKFDLFAVGSEHGIIKHKERVLSWGWGEHGNCGVRKKNSETFDYFNEIFLENDTEKVINIFGGCATTWITTSKK
ncbi:hypothetical protein WICMUC_002796 [Wickerhamomyces mucosus]|uniref:Uncharacterized protein n=1 Tax=Wickerhamomyces mucosus TaxID=1378264 RepID=A0A9P8TE10_9ASCO|nr:hypothetical protein WICMUC_002796 [Wickerhamomyces mucosus]